jgi:biofilm PGA synthesis protein PgaD
MCKFILDQYNHQSLVKRFLGNSLTGLAWVFWGYLWLPLIAAIALLPEEARPEPVTSVASSPIMALTATLASHAGMVVIMIGVFFGWSLLQFLGKRHRNEILQKYQASVPNQRVSDIHSAIELKYWQHAQSMVVSHDEINGFIKRVEILNSKN